MNANKLAGGGSSGAGLGALVVYVAQRLGVNLTAEDGAWVAIGLAAVGAFVAHRGLRGLFSSLWRGQPAA